MTTATAKTANPLGTDPIPALIRRFAIPSIIGMLVNAAYNITDQIFIGHRVGMLGNAATNVAFPITTLALALAQLIGIGTATQFNLNVGAEKEEEAEKFLATGLTWVVIIGSLIGLAARFFTEPLLLLFGSTRTVLPYAYEYLHVTAIGVPFQLFVMMSNFLIRADGSPKYSMFSTAVGGILNVFLDWLFMFPFQMGIRGAALATVIAQITSFAISLHYFIPHRYTVLGRIRKDKTCCGLEDLHFNTIELRPKTFGLRPVYLFNIAKLGLANFLNQIIRMVVIIVTNNTLRHYGAATIYGSDIPLAIAGILAKLNSIVVAFVVGLALGCQPIWSFNMGAKQYDRVKDTYRFGLKRNLMISMTAFVLLQLFPRQIIGIFGGGSELYFEFGVRYIRIFMLMIGLFGVQPLTINYFTSTGNVKNGLLLTISRHGLFLLPLLLILPPFMGLDGALIAGPIADILAFALALLLARGSFRKFNRLAAADTAAE